MHQFAEGKGIKHKDTKDTKTPEGRIIVFFNAALWCLCVLCVFVFKLRNSNEH